MLGICYNTLYVCLMHSICSLYVKCTLDMHKSILVISPDTSQLVNIQYIVYPLGSRFFHLKLGRVSMYCECANYFIGCANALFYLSECDWAFSREAMPEYCQRQPTSQQQEAQSAERGEDRKTVTSGCLSGRGALWGNSASKRSAG